MNTIKTIFLMGVLTAIIVLIGGFLGGKTGIMAAFVFAVVTNIGSYWFSDKLALSMSHAQPIERDQAPQLYEIIERLCSQADLPMPRVYLIPTESPNAFATGRNPEHAAVAVTEGILRLMSAKELEAVLAHELGHVRNRDILITTMAAVLASVITMIAHWGMYLGSSYDDERGGRSANPVLMLLMVILAPIAAMLINLAISRAREYQADATGAKICHHPEALASALSKLESGAQAIPYPDANPALSSLYIVTPNPGAWFANLMSTHPPIEDRIRRLQEMSGQMR